MTLTLWKDWNIFLFFFFSSRRRHTRFDCDWSSDVCSSDLVPRRVRPVRGLAESKARAASREERVQPRARPEDGQTPQRRSEERRVGKSVDLGGRRIIKKKKKKKTIIMRLVQNRKKDNIIIR